MDREEPTMEYIQQKADELIAHHRDSGCAPLEPIALNWDDPSVPGESLKLYSDYIQQEVMTRPPYATSDERKRELGPKTELILKMTPLERMAVDILR